MPAYDRPNRLVPLNWTRQVGRVCPQIAAHPVLKFLWAAILLGVLAGCRPDASETSHAANPPVSVQAVLPHRGEIARSITLPSFRILALQEATLYAKVSGYLKTITVDKGDTVKEGQLLAELEVPELLADEAQYKAESAVARTNYERM